MFVDEAGFSLLPGRAATYAPRAQTPILHVPLRWDHLSVISAITPNGKLYFMLQQMAFDGPSVVRFIQHLLGHISGKLLLIWDRLPAHHGQVVKDFLTQGAAQRIHLEQLPAYAPDLNPDEGIWRYLKQVEMKNLCCHDLSQLALALRQAIARLRHKTHIILACFQQAHLLPNV